MRVVKEIVHPVCKITIFQWNNRYIIKLEETHLEQTFKIDALDITDESDLQKIIDQIFIEQASSRFAEMARSLQEALQRS